MITKNNIFTCVEVECDCCGYVVRLEPEAGRVDTVYTATTTFREMGWLIGEKNVCPKCKANNRKP